MKKIVIILISLSTVSLINAQWCVTLHKFHESVVFNSSDDQITRLEIDHQGNMWFNIMNQWGGAGLGKYTGTEWISFYTGTDITTKLSPTVNAIAFDMMDSVWVGTENGLAQFDGISTGGWKIYKKVAGSLMPDNKVKAIAIDNLNIKWVGFGSGQLASLIGQTWAVFNPPQYTNKAITDIEIDIEGNLWVARKGNPGLLKFRDGVFTPFPAFTDIENIKADQFGRVLISSKDSLVVMHSDAIINVIHTDTLMDYSLYDIEVSNLGTIWVSSSKGLLVKAGSTFRRYDKYKSAVPDLISPIPLMYDMAGNLWFSFTYKGINHNYAGIGFIYKTVSLPSSISILDKPLPQFCFGGSITLDANTDAANYIWADGTSADRTITIYDTKTIDVAIGKEKECLLTDTVTYTVNLKLRDTVICILQNQCYYYDTISVKAQHVFKDEKPCVVTVSQDYKNLIVWEKTAEVGTASYNVYKETMTDSFTFLANVAAGNLSVFRDNLSDPRKKSAKYKISSVDTCGNESGQSFYHRTMHLQVSAGAQPTDVNLSWQNYEGFWFPRYIVYRGKSLDDLVVYDSVNADKNNLTWTDYGITERYYYRVGVELPFWCAPTGTVGKKADTGPYSHSMSNIEENRLQDTAGGVFNPGLIEIQSYPNPFSIWTQIDFENSLRYPYELSVTNMSGKLVRLVSDIRDNRVVFLREDLPQGFYLFELRGDKVYRGKFVIK